MDYLYLERPMPTNATGVSVHLTAIDPNGNSQDIGRVVSDTQGKYSYSYNAPVPGLYTITATFDGSNSYFGSAGETSFIVTTAASAPAVVVTQPPSQTATPTTAAPTQTTQPTPTTSPSPAIQPTSGTPMTTYVVIAAVIVIIVVAAAAVLLKRRK
jgi:hypothetical protein